MRVEGVLISHKDNFNQNTSGILLNSDLVLVPGNFLLPFAQEETWVSSFLKSTSMDVKPDFSINKTSFRVFLEPKNDQTKNKFFECRVARAWKCPAVSESLRKIFSEWTLGHADSKNEWEFSIASDTELSRELLSVFVLLRREDGCNDSDDEHVLVSLIPLLEEPFRGQKVEIVSTPFGNEHFMNSLSHGVISNVTGVDNCIILSDARSAPGCEGGPIFAFKKPKEKGERKLIGQVICCLSWWRGERVGLTIGINLRPVLKRFLKLTDDGKVSNLIGNKLGNNSSDLLPIDLVDETVVLIRSETYWGSGVVLCATSGIIITCSHVVKDDKKVYVLYKGKLWAADVIFRSRENVAYDLAVIKTEENFIFNKEIEFSEFPAEIGDAVFAAGFPFFSEQDDLYIKPTIVYGSVAKVNPYMIQTTCCIQSGFSGGALFKNGKLLGIIVSNAKDSSAGHYFPHINFIVPSSVFRNPVLKYIRQRDSFDLKKLESSSSRVQLLWNLQPSKM